MDGFNKYNKMLRLFVAILTLQKTIVKSDSPQTSTTTTTIQQLPPVCEMCNCTLNPTKSLLDVQCTNAFLRKGYIFNDTVWQQCDGENNNATCPHYQNVSIHQLSTLVTFDWHLPHVYMSNLTRLDLSQNGFVHVGDNVFADLQQMTTLNLSENRIETLQPDVFKGVFLEGDYMPLRALKSLHLDGNRLHSLDGDLFEHTGRLETLTLSRNRFKVIDHQTAIAITSLIYLKHLDLSEMSLRHLPDHLLHTPRYLQWLDLSRNQFEHVPDTLGDVHTLQTLHFNGNPLVNLTHFPAIPTLEELHLCQMPRLQRIENQSLSGLSTLIELRICDNAQLWRIDGGALASRRQPNEYEIWPPLRKLSLRNNKLTTIDFHLYAHWEDLIELELEENPWTCACENQWMLDELMPLYQRLNGVERLECAAPIEMQQRTLYELYTSKTHMRCLDAYGNRPERDAMLLVGILAGLLMAIPMIFAAMFVYQRNWFGVCDRSAAAYSRQFYMRTTNPVADQQMADEYF